MLLPKTATLPAKTDRQPFHTLMARRPQRGAAALEYILVSTFAAVVTIGALGFIGKIVKDQLTNMGSRLGVAEEPDLVDPFGEGS